MKVLNTCQKEKELGKEAKLTVHISVGKDDKFSFHYSEKHYCYCYKHENKLKQL